MNDHELLEKIHETELEIQQAQSQIAKHEAECALRMESIRSDFAAGRAEFRKLHRLLLVVGGVVLVSGHDEALSLVELLGKFL